MIKLTITKRRQILDDNLFHRRLLDELLLLLRTTQVKLNSPRSSSLHVVDDFHERFELKKLIINKTDSLIEVLLIISFCCSNRNITIDIHH